MNWQQLLCGERFRASPSRPAEDGRSEFQKDYDRIVFSRSFRRLQGKTQVHPFPNNDHVHTRLSHSLEAASVGRSLGARVGLHLNQTGKLPKTVRPADVGSIVQAACLAHDIGNPPFGHAGESAIGDWFIWNADYLKDLSAEQRTDFSHFEGNAQGLRVLTQLEGHLFDGGLRLTYATLGTFLKYPWPSNLMGNKKKFGYFHSENKIVRDIAEKVGLDDQGQGCWARHPLVYLVEAADDICYAIIDLEDAWEMDILSISEIETILKLGLAKRERQEYLKIPAKDPPRRLAYIRGKVVDFLLRHAVNAFITNEKAILTGQLSGDLIDHCASKNARHIIAKAKAKAARDIFNDRRKTQQEIGPYSVVDVLLQALCAAVVEQRKEGHPSFRSKRIFDLLGVYGPNRADNIYAALLRMTDFVSGMTDKYALQLSQEFAGLALQSVGIT